jgi:site-specific DNA recombinase
MFSPKVEFAGKSFQTPKMNIVAQFICQYNSGLGNKKNRHKRVKTSNVGLVTSTGFKPVTS